MSINLSRVSDLNWEGEMHYCQGEYQKALICFDKVLVLRPRDSFALRSMKKILFRIKPVYYDTSIWISHLLDDSFSLTCSELIKGKESQTDMIIVPRLVIMETIQAIRHKVMFTNRDKNLKPNEYPAEFRRIEALEKINKFSILLNNMITEGRIIRDTGLISSKTLTDRASDIFEKYDQWTVSCIGKCENCGHVDLVDDRCEMCNKRICSDKLAYRGLGYVDIQHVCIAAAHYASEFFSSDVAFKHLAHHEMFPKITFGIIRGKGDSLRIDRFG